MTTPTVSFGDDPEGIFSDAARIPAGTVDLRDLYRSLPTTPGRRPRTGSESRRHARIIDRHTCEVTATPIRVAGLIDGVQARSLLLYRQQRPITLECAIAGCWWRELKPPLRSRLTLTCSWLDEDYLRSAAPGVPVVVLDEVFPEDLEAVQAALCDQMRRHMERLAWEEATAGPGQVVIVDGDLSRVPPGCDHLVGIVNQAGAQYWDEAELASLPHGHIGPILELPARRRQERCRYSTQLRLVPAGEDQPWDHGLIRLESFDPELLEPLAALCLRNAQHPGEDTRWAVQIRPMRLTEDALKGRLPAYFDM